MPCRRLCGIATCLALCAVTVQGQSWLSRLPSAVDDLCKEEGSVGAPTLPQATAHAACPNTCAHGRLVTELFVLGAQRASTTVLCEDLTRSYQMHQPKCGGPRSHAVFQSLKEPNLFDSKEGSFAPGPKRWLPRFPNCSCEERMVVFDCSTYLHKPRVARNLHSWYAHRAPNLKFVVLLREPLARAHSAFWHELHLLWATRGEKRDITFPAYAARVLQDPSDAFLVEGRPFRDSLYAEQLAEYFRYFKPSQFLFVPYKLSRRRLATDESLAMFIFGSLSVCGRLGPPEEQSKSKMPRILQEELRQAPHVLADLRSLLHASGGGARGFARGQRGGDVPLRG